METYKNILKEAEWKKSQREAKNLARRGYLIKPENNKPGKRFRDMTGREYEIQEDGSWRRVDVRSE